MRRIIPSLVSTSSLVLVALVPVSAQADNHNPQLWVENPYRIVYRTSTAPQVPASSIELVAARNEYESAQIALRSAAAFEIEEVEFSALATDSGDVIAADNLSYRFVEYREDATVEANAWFPDRVGNPLYPESVVPDPLSNASSMQVGADSTQPVFVTGYVPADATPGRYDGMVTLHTTIGEFDVPISIDVYDVEVPGIADANFVNYQWTMTNGFTWDGFLWDGELVEDTPAFDVGEHYYGVETYSDEWFDLMDEFARVLTDYRTNMVWVRTDLFLTATGTDMADFVDGVPEDLDWSLFDRYVQTFVDRGISDFANQHLIHALNRMPEEEKPDSSWSDALPDELPQTDAYVENYLTALHEHLEEKGWTAEQGFTWYQHILDEPITENQKNWWTYTARKIKEVNAATGATFTTMDADPDGILMDDDVKDYVDVWVPMTPDFEDRKDQYKEEQAAGKDLWVYTCEVNTPPWLNRFWTQPTLTGRLLYWNLSQEGVQGHLHWGWNAWYVGPWFGDSFIVYPDRDNATVKSSLRFEANRDGVEDYELLHLIKQDRPDLARELADAVVSPDDPRAYTLDPDYVTALHAYLVKSAAGEDAGELPEPTSPYRGQEAPATHLVDSSDPDVLYSGDWFARSRQYAYQGGVQTTSTAGDEATFEFSGAGIDVVVEQNEASGRMAVSVNGADPQIVDLYEKVQQDYVTTVRVRGLEAGEQHTISVTNLDDAELSLDAFRIHLYDGQEIHDASLQDLQIDDVPLPFDRNRTEYQAILPDGAETVSVTPTLRDERGSIEINGVHVANGATVDARILDGLSEINVRVTAADGQTNRSYTVRLLKGRANEPTVNVARDYAEITASATRPGDGGVTFGPQKMVDGDYGTMFASLQGYNDEHPFPHEIVLTWDEPQAFNIMVMATPSGVLQGITDVDLQVPSSGGDWETAAARVPFRWTRDRDDGVMEHLFASVPRVEDVTELRIQINDANYRSWNMYAVYELELYDMVDNGEAEIAVEAPSLTGLRDKLAGYVDAGEVTGPLARLLENELRQAVRHEADVQRATRHLRMFIEHLERTGFERYATAEARAILSKGAKDLIGLWTG
jgi:hypothetical protein